MAPNNKMTRKLLDALSRGPATSHYPCRIGIYQCPGRVKELRDRFGYRIRTTRVTLVNSDINTRERRVLNALEGLAAMLSNDAENAHAALKGNQRRLRQGGA